MANLTKSQKLARTNAIGFAAYNAALRTAAVTHYIDDKGRKVRKINGADHRDHVSDKEVAEFLAHNRAVEEEEVLEALGLNVFKSLVKRDMIRQSAPGAFFWINQAAADKYRMPALRGAKFPR